MSPSLLAVVGARPNFVKMAPILDALGEGRGVEVRLLHTGQHYDRALSEGLIERLGMAAPDVNLGVGSGTHGEQAGAVMVGVERDLAEHRPAAVLVAGDVNSTMAAALAATKLNGPVGHVESGLRSRDWSMPEEINRVVTDRLSDLLLCTSQDAVDNLAAEGIAGEGVRLVGNTMIDSLLRILGGIDREEVLAAQGLEHRGFALVTLHRPALVDDPEQLRPAIEVLGALSKTLPVVFPAHPRTTSRLEAAGVEVGEAVRLLEPLDYPEFIALESEARLVVTDSGGLQEETSVLGVPCITYRETTERPVTVDLGTNRLVGVDPAALGEAIDAVLAADFPERPPEIPLWDGHAGPRAAEALVDHYGW
ncbi:MAG: non-hydrolyzing UDP-N-acetylglucosamine 2-epimerase [Solirubrobacterales bacterium]